MSTDKWWRTDPGRDGCRVTAFAFAREPGLACVLNPSTAAVPLPTHVEVLLASGPLDGDALPVDTAAWLRRPL
jgi:hypothetical protein